MLESTLALGLGRLDLSLDAVIQKKLIDYIELIQKWNRVYNLTAVREADKMLTHHVLDSLAVVRHVRGDSILDVGSGAGLPGIPLALALPRTRVTLLESNHKKTAFLKQVLMELVLDNATVVSARVETWRSAQLFDTVISRAFSDLAEFVSLAGHLCTAGGVLAAMKGVYPHEELAQLPGAYKLQEVIELDVPGVEGKRHLVLMKHA